MGIELLLILSVVFGLIALMYSSVGHAGASGYLAVMILLGVAPAVMKPTALCLNIAVSTVVCAHLWRSGRLDWRGLLPFVLGSVPMAAVGGAMHLSDKSYLQWLAAAMVGSGALLFVRTLSQNTGVVEPKTSTISIPVALVIGGVIGVLSGITGTGGGIFLSPVLILFGLANMRTTAALTAPFILLNSVAGLSSNVLSTQILPDGLWWLMVVVVAGGYLGANLGTHFLSSKTLLRVLSAVMVLSASKLLLA